MYIYICVPSPFYVHIYVYIDIYLFLTGVICTFMHKCEYLQTYIYTPIIKKYKSALWFFCSPQADTNQRFHFISAPACNVTYNCCCCHGAWGGRPQGPGEESPHRLGPLSLTSRGIDWAGMQIGVGTNQNIIQKPDILYKALAKKSKQSPKRNDKAPKD